MARGDFWGCPACGVQGVRPKVAKCARVPQEALSADPAPSPADPGPRRRFSHLKTAPCGKRDEHKGAAELALPKAVRSPARAGAPREPPSAAVRPSLRCKEMGPSMGLKTVLFSALGELGRRKAWDFRSLRVQGAHPGPKAALERGPLAHLSPSPGGCSEGLLRSTLLDAVDHEALFKEALGQAELSLRYYRRLLQQVRLWGPHLARRKTWLAAKTKRAPFWRRAGRAWRRAVEQPGSGVLLRSAVRHGRLRSVATFRQMPAMEALRRRNGARAGHAT
ncbi:hypothetical protein M885DRAFT_325696 [Pelagophyceae sp. CCMP2097]|nr:hypothetical protein M885DRAFT_325696 [Pelagophyceae sp. CCMP2097]